MHDAHRVGERDGSGDIGGADLTEVIATFEPQAFAATWRRSLESPPAGVWTLLVATAGTQVAGTASVGPSQDPDADPLETDQCTVTDPAGSFTLGAGATRTVTGEITATQAPAAGRKLFGAMEVQNVPPAGSEPGVLGRGEVIITAVN